MVQLYLGEKTVSPENPEKELKAFEKICLRPRETKTVLLKITMEDFMHYDEAAGTWRLKHGDYRIYGSPAGYPVDTGYYDISSKCRASEKMRGFLFSFPML